MPRVLIKKYDYAVTDFCKWLKGEMRKNGIRQTDMASVLGTTQQAFSYKIRGGACNVKDMVIIFTKLQTEPEKIGELLKR